LQSAQQVTPPGAAQQVAAVDDTSVDRVIDSKVEEERVAGEEDLLAKGK
jgi:hypothetical protein